jgi:hypothetical protein
LIETSQGRVAFPGTPGIRGGRAAAERVAGHALVGEGDMSQMGRNPNPRPAGQETRRAELATVELC